MYIDPIYIGIIILIVTLGILNTFNKKNNIEKFIPQTFPDNGVNYNITSDINGFVGLTNFGNSQLKNYGKFGEIPPIPICNKTLLNYGCKNYDYPNQKDEYQSTCQKSIGNFMNRQDLTMPILGDAWTPGKVRQCRTLYTPKCE